MAIMTTRSASVAWELYYMEKNQKRKNLHRFRISMMLILCVALFLVAYLQRPRVVAPVNFTAEVTRNEIRALFNLWSDTLDKGDPFAMADLYLLDGENQPGNSGNHHSMVLLPTLSDIPRSDRSSIKDYYLSFMKDHPRCHQLEHGDIRVGLDWAHDAGIYAFTFHNNSVPMTRVRARYSFFYLKDNTGQWKIAHHHSSKMPKKWKSVVWPPD